MRLIVDECTGVIVARWLTSLGHDVLSIRDTFPRLPDEDILDLAVRTDRIVITNDKGFGTLVFRDQRPHRGVILLRLPDPYVATRIAAIQRVLDDLPDNLATAVVVVTEHAVRVTRGGSTENALGDV